MTFFEPTQAEATRMMIAMIFLFTGVTFVMVGLLFVKFWKKKGG